MNELHSYEYNILPHYNPDNCDCKTTDVDSAKVGVDNEQIHLLK